MSDRLIQSSPQDNLPEDIEPYRGRSYFDFANKLLGTQLDTDYVPDYLRPYTATAGTAPSALTVPAEPEKTPLQQVLKFYGGIGRDLGAAGLQIGPTAVQSVANLACMVTGDRVGKGLWETMETGKKAIQEQIGTPMLNEQRKAFEQDMANPDKTVSGVILSGFKHPRAVLESAIVNGGTTVLEGGPGKLIRHAPALKTIYEGSRKAGAGAEEAVNIVTKALLNAGNTFSSKELENHSLRDRYTGAAVSMAASAGAGKTFGGGGIAKTFVKGAVEEGGNVAGESAATGQMPDLDDLLKRVIYGGALGNPPK